MNDSNKETNPEFGVESDVEKHASTLDEQTSTPGNSGSLFVQMFFAVGILAALLSVPGMGQSTTATGKFAIAIHGGAGGSRSLFNEAANVARETAMQEALDIGKKILAEGGTAMDAVEQVIIRLENDPQFNAGKGAVINAAGKHELDASIMDGSNKACGAVAGVSTVKNPISLARLVMSETRHVLLAAEGAETFAHLQNVERVENSYFTTPERKSSWERFNKRLKAKEKEKAGTSSMPTEAKEKRQLIGTVGCVALDSHGNLAAGTSTGGMTNKKFGRVGDSPVVGAGTYADNMTCAVSGTGIGEQYIRNAVAYDVSAQMKYKGAKLQEAIDDNLENRLEKNDGGLIAVDKDGNIATGTNTAGMIRGIANSDGLSEVSW